MLRLIGALDCPRQRFGDDFAARVGPVIFARNRLLDFVPQWPTLIRVDHDCRPLTHGRIKPQPRDEAFVPPIVATPECVTLAIAYPTQPVERRLFQSRELWLQHFGSQSGRKPEG